MTREMGKVIKETRGDVQEPLTAATIPPAKAVACLARPYVGAANKFAMAIRQPLGVCA